MNRLRPDTVTIRVAAQADAEAIAALAGRDSRPVPPAPHLVAERDGSIEAVISLADQAVVADPFRPTAELVELLRCRALAIVVPAGGAPRPARPLAEPRLASRGCT